VKGGRAKAPKRRAGPTIRFYPNDPDAPVGLQSATPVEPGVGEPSFTIEGERYAPAPYDPGTLEFQYWQGEVALARTIRVWEDLFERDFTQWHDGHPLRVKLRAGKDLNAFYDRKSLQFFYDVNQKTGRTVYAAESLDIVAHEAGHAVLDVYQPGFWSTPDLETASFHEAFADCSALLVTLTDSAVRMALLEEAAGDWDKSNQVSRLAEALGRAIYDNYGPGALSDPTRLRDARNDFRYADPVTLPPGADDSDLSPEPHSFSRVFTGAFYDAMVWALARALRLGPNVDAIEDARRLLGRLLARAIEKLPPGNARYADVAALMRETDQAEEGGSATVGSRFPTWNDAIPVRDRAGVDSVDHGHANSVEQLTAPLVHPVELLHSLGFEVLGDLVDTDDVGRMFLRDRDQVSYVIGMSVGDEDEIDRRKRLRGCGAGGVTLDPRVRQDRLPLRRTVKHRAMPEPRDRDAQRLLHRPSGRHPAAARDIQPGRS
jgi:hypothetical protein